MAPVGRSRSMAMSTLKFEPEADGSFYAVVRQRVDDYLKKSGQSQRAGRVLLVKAIILTSLVVGSYAAMLLIGKGWVLLPLGLVFGISSLLLAINVGHD